MAWTKAASRSEKNRDFKTKMCVMIFCGPLSAMLEFGPKIHFMEITEISKSERIPLAGSYGLLLLNCDLLLSLIRDYNYKEKEPNFNFPINVIARGKQIMMDI